MLYTITDGQKADYIGQGHEFSFECRLDDVDTAYDVLAENLRLHHGDGQDLIDFENVKDTNVEVMLEDIKQLGFIDSWTKKEG